MSDKSPLSFVFFQTVSLPPPVTGVFATLVVLVSFVSLELLTGRPGELIAGHDPAAVGCAWLVGDYRISFLSILLLMYAATARFILAQVTLNNAALLQAAEDFLDIDRLATLRWWGWIPGLVGIAVVLVSAIDIAEREVEWTSEYWILPHFINWAWCVPFGWIAGRFIFATIGNGILVSRLAATVPCDSVFNASVLQPAVRQSSMSALLLTLMFGILSVHFVDPGAGYASVALVLSLVIVCFACSGIAAWGAGRRLLQLRNSELQRVRAEILSMEKATLKSESVSVERMQNLLLLETRILDAKINPIQASTAARGVFYAALGLLSWLGAATVERILDQLLS